MIQQEMIQYQSLDGELNRIEKELKKNDSFIKRKQFKALSQECEENLAKLDAKAQELKNQLAAAKVTMEKITAVIEEHSKEIAALEDIDELNYMNKQLNVQLTDLSNVDKDIKRIIREGEEIAKSFDEINAKLPKIVVAYKKANEDFNKATEEVKPRVTELKLKQAELKKVIEPSLFEIYKKVSEGGLHPVFVPLRDGSRCGGCQMEMPKAVVDTQMAGKSYMRCEHCGRIIYKDE
ncbi:MAG: hypothetical protein J1G02_01050 [Clostridiales bacterium]|nr:hypothetical protein [Clostridiales bacterium]